MKSYYSFFYHARLENCLQVDDTKAEYYLQLGKLLWMKRHDGTEFQDQCFNILLKVSRFAEIYN